MKSIYGLLRLATFTFTLFQVTAIIYAVSKPSRPSKPSQPSSPSKPTGAPIDGGASLLLASGAVYAVRRIRKARK